MASVCNSFSKEKTCNLYSILVEYKASLETDELNNTHPWLAQEICTRSAHAAVSEASADALHKKAGEF